jgi:hypothetical protein
VAARGLEELEEGIEVQVFNTSRDYGGVEYAEMEADGEIYTGESEWIVFKSSKDAEKYAVAYVEDQIEDDPGMFVQDWLQNFLKVPSGTAKIIAQEDADNYVEDIAEYEPDRIVDEAGMSREYDKLEEQIDELGTELFSVYIPGDKRKLEKEMDKLEKKQEKIVEKAKKKVHKALVKETLRRLKDPLEYAQDLGYDLSRGLPDWIEIDTAKAAANAVRTDGVAHFLDRYDGKDLVLPNGAIAFGTN